MNGDEHVQDLETIELPDGDSVTVDHAAAKLAMPPDVWAATLKHIKEHGMMGPGLP
jgi:hypothetical protein